MRDATVGGHAAMVAAARRRGAADAAVGPRMGVVAADGRGAAASARHAAIVAVLAFASACTETPTETDGGERADAIACGSAAACDDGRYCNGAERCIAAACAAGPAPCAGACDEAGDLCTGDCDLDGDGHEAPGCGGHDCDDADPARFPGALEVCDAADRDEDCDPSSFGSRDADGDGHVDARCCNDGPGEPRCGDDCDDAFPAAHPGEAEECDGVDNDCDGAIDEGVGRTYYADADGDGFGDALAPRVACHREPGQSPLAGDCDDLDPGASPGLPEVCDAAGRDEDCDGEANPPARCACTGAASRGCPLPGACAAGTETCVSGAWSACSIAAVAETCDGDDDDCDGETDEGLTIRCWVDGDDDTYPAAAAPELWSCPAVGRISAGGCPPGRTSRDPGVGPLDCDDLRAAVRPLAPERPNGFDDDCDGEIDEP